MVDTVESTDAIRLAVDYEVDDCDTLESFLCDLLDVSVNQLYELVDEEKRKRGLK